jgi:O-antigen chain-terminating methyltransferase
MTKGVEVDLEAVKAEIMEEVEALRKRRGGTVWMPESSAETASTQPTDEIMRILDLDNAAFLRAAYQCILGRPIDSVGYVDAMDGLIEGEPRSDVLWRLVESTEARLKGVEPSFLLGNRPEAVSGQRSANRSLFGRLASWIVRLRHAPARISVLGHDLRRLSLKVDWLLSQSADVEVSRVEVASSMSQHLRELQEHSEAALEALESELNKRLERLQQAWEAVSEGLQRQLDVAAEQCRDLVNSAGASASEMRTTIDDVRQLERRLLVDEYRLADAELRTRHDRVNVAPEPILGSWRQPAESTDAGGELLYLALEDAFRGTDAVIRSRLELYVPRVAACGAGTTDSPVIDLGCGRGEWLQLLTDQGYRAKGVDNSIVMTELCRVKGLDVECIDAVDYLSGMRPASAGMITAFHIIEHLPFEQLLQIVDLSLRALRPGGMLILETPNPENIVVATCNFYVDPTHVRPIPPDLLEFLVRARGFGDVETLRLHPLEMVRSSKEHPEWLNPVLDRFNCSQDYAVVAVRPGSRCDGHGHDESQGSTV